MTTEVVAVTVTRNLHRPVFEITEYEKVILETTVIGDTVAHVIAEDGDSRVCNNGL